jgi:hypothetical protein
MSVATTNGSNGKTKQATFLKVGQNLYRNESSDTYYGLTKRGGKQFRTALRMEDGTPIKDRGLAERATAKMRTLLIIDTGKRSGQRRKNATRLSSCQSIVCRLR